MNEVPHSYLYHKIKVTENCSVRIDLRAPQGSVVFECIPFFHTILEPLLFASGVKSPTLFRQVHTIRSGESSTAYVLDRLRIHILRYLG